MSSDPRGENARAYHMGADGTVDGIELVYLPMPSSAYELIHADFIPEREAAGNTVANFVVYDRTGIPAMERVYLAWPWPSMNEGKLLPGNQNGQHMVTNGFVPPNLGPLGMFVGDAAGNPISDLIGGIGLPINRHVCFRLVWRERWPEDPDDGGGDDPGGSVDLAGVVAAINRTTAALVDLKNTLREINRLE